MRSISLAALSLAVVPTFSTAAIYDYDFSLTVSEASISTPSDVARPDAPQPPTFSEFFGGYVGQSGSGSLTVRVDDAATGTDPFNNPGFEFENCRFINFDCISQGNSMFSEFITLSEDGEGISFLSGTRVQDGRFLAYDISPNGGAAEFNREFLHLSPFGTASITYQITDFTLSGPTTGTPEITPVPLPASGVLLVAGLGGLGFWRRRTA